MKTRFLVVLSVAVALTGIISFNLFAQGDAAGVIQYRQKVMGAVGGNFGGIGAILKNKLDFKGNIPQHASAIADLAKLIPAVFPKGSGKGNTDALPKIWQDWDGFKTAAGNLEKEASKLAQIADSGDAGKIEAQVKAVGKACGDCHKKFRQPKEKRGAWKKK